jgi:parallel beta-helix repeat protein/predicted outer membrane repeat protein
MNRWKCVMFAAVVAVCVSGTAAYAQNAAPRSYYVRADGDDENNNGRNEDKPFKTLSKAVDAAAKGMIKRITVLGKIVIAPPGIVISDTGADEILVTGKPDAAEGEKAEITIANERYGGFRVSGVNIRFTYISLPKIRLGGNVTLGAGALVSGIDVGYNGNITMTDDAVVRGDISSSDILQITKSDHTVITGGKGIRGGYQKLTPITMSGNSRIVNNTSDNGGGIFVTGASSSITMSDDAEISGNTASNGGGGIYINGSNDGKATLTMSGNARVVNNSSHRNGGGIYAERNSVITISDNAHIGGNTANATGGGIYSMGQVTLNGGEISGNTAKNGGGVFTTEEGEVSMTGGTITGNKAEYGAGVFAGKGSGSFTLKGGSITDNEAEFVGGGVYVEKGATYTAEGGTVTNNTAGDGGNNVFRQQ